MFFLMLMLFMNKTDGDTGGAHVSTDHTAHRNQTAVFQSVPLSCHLHKLLSEFPIQSVPEIDRVAVIRLFFFKLLPETLDGAFAPSGLSQHNQLLIS